MPKPSQSGFKRFFYNQNIKRDKSSNKYKNLFNHIVLLLKRTERDGETKWISNAFAKAQLKITSYGISARQVVAILEHKGLMRFEKMLNDTLFFVQKKGASAIQTVKKVAPKTEKTEKVEKKAVVKKVAVKKVAPKTEKTEKVEKKAVVKKVAVKKVAPKTEKTTKVKK